MDNDTYVNGPLDEQPSTPAPTTSRLAELKAETRALRNIVKGFEQLEALGTVQLLAALNYCYQRFSKAPNK